MYHCIVVVMSVSVPFHDSEHEVVELTPGISVVSRHILCYLKSDHESTTLTTTQYCAMLTWMLLVLSTSSPLALLSTSRLSSSVLKVTLRGGQPPISVSVGMSLNNPDTFISRRMPRVFLQCAWLCFEQSPPQSYLIISLTTLALEKKFSLSPTGTP